MRASIATSAEVWPVWEMDYAAAACIVGFTARVTSTPTA